MDCSRKAHTLARGIRLFVVATLLGAVVNLAAPPPVAHAATIAVNTSDDELNSDGDCSLREAIQAANTNAAVSGCAAGQAAPNLDTITFAAATNGNPIVLAGAADEDANASGDLDILDGGDLTIQGNGAANTIIDGGGIDRVFHICPGGGCANTVTFDGVTIRNGNVFRQSAVASTTRAARRRWMAAPSAPTRPTYGGGIYNEATLNVRTAAPSAGLARVTRPPQRWRHLQRSAGTTTVDGSTVSANTANYGGGIYNQATLNVTNGSTIGGAGAGNTATAMAAASTTYGGTTTVDGSTVSANTGRQRRRHLQRRHAERPERQHHRRGRRGQHGHRRRRRHLQLAGTTTVDGSTVSANTANSRRRHLQRGHAERPERQHHRRGRRGQHGRRLTAAASTTRAAQRRWMAARSVPTRPTTAVAASITWPARRQWMAAPSVPTRPVQAAASTMKTD